MARPVLGIIACNRQTSAEPAVTVMRRYVEHAIRYADCAALIVPSLPGVMTAAEVAPRLDALLLTGSPSNVEPKRYGDREGAKDEQGPFDPDRDTMALELIAAMRELGRPILGICRGFQEINVAFGGTLRRDLGDAHHAPDGVAFEAMFAHRHPVALTPGGSLAAAYGRDRLEVNSVHYQGIGRLGDGLTVEAVAADGVIEAVGAPGLLAVQWHPEWATGDDPDARTLFRRFGDLARGA